MLSFRKKLIVERLLLSIIEFRYVMMPSVTERGHLVDHKELFRLSLSYFTKKVDSFNLFKLSHLSHSQVLAILLQYFLPRCSLKLLFFLRLIALLFLVGHFVGLRKSFVTELIGGWLNFSSS
jgi:hypothetical protein